MTPSREGFYEGMEAAARDVDSWIGLGTEGSLISQQLDALAKAIAEGIRKRAERHKEYEEKFDAITRDLS